MNESFWKDKYPPGIPADIDPDQYPNLQQVLKAACQRFASKPAFSNLGQTLTYAELYRLSGIFAAYLQGIDDLRPGDRIAIQLPNLLQFPVAVFGALRAGLVVVNTNPLYTEREMRLQFGDSGAKALVCLDSMADRVEAVLPATDIRQVVVTGVGDLLSPLRRLVVNAVLHSKKLIPAHQPPQAVRFTDAMARGRHRLLREVDPAGGELAMLQYTGGTTGVAKGAMLTHRNLVANMLQCQAMVAAGLGEGGETIITPLPLYHVYAFTFHCLAMLVTGNHNVLITNPRDLPALVRELGRWHFSCFVGLNTLFAALCNDERFRRLDFSALKLTLSGGMALRQATAERWEDITGCGICEGYGLTEASPVVAVNPFHHYRPGSIGMPMPSTLCKVIDEQGEELPFGQPGELCVKGPQVMKGYWRNPAASAEVLDAQGWLKTGDIALIEADGYIRLVDRKKDMILVSGFNVYPNELEEVLSGLPGVAQCAAIGVPDRLSGEAIKLLVVPVAGAELTPEGVRHFMRSNLVGYKRPKYVEFRDSLPTSTVGKILRRELREAERVRGEAGQGS